VLPCCSRIDCDVTTRLPNAAVSALTAATMAARSRDRTGFALVDVVSTPTIEG